MNGEKRIVGWDELAEHSNRTSLWVVIEGQVFDVTTYLAEHPGGDDILIKYGGLDGTQKFLEVNHSNYARSLRNARLVGTLTSDPQPNDYLKAVKSKKQKNNFNPNRQITWEELGQHNKKEDLWIVIEGKVYDVTDFQDDHPGGPAILLGKAGDDATAAFHDANHSQSAYKQLEKLQVGVITGVKPNLSGSGSSTNLIFVILLILAIGAGIFVITK
ncbi:unnamed protein product (macronuclear) [Paramecium tetraurelia]|uniref:Cytochrome b5 heme-binding domain-containing protein n=1 Tax=Paramecium tetraurelia TaxID=5888 RepID=A0E8J8_PARTE|nr:uncharacterized protein GSPATT00024344001 [Paramecium tetraurelia]CAK91615.1 unnamed protein product [Paramecium tetraurelia]|eukprot:XP_001459012.1 hypothetical protein (macronuclear) [Paramecium tetraurelia strain d4-2]